MKAVVVSRPGGPEVLDWRDVPDPRPGPDEVLVRVRATAANRADLLQRLGRYPAPPGSPADIPGLELAGEVERVGSRVEHLRPGGRVMGILGGGGYAEQAVLHEGLCLPVPRGMAWQDAAAIPEAFVTAFDALILQAGLAAGERLLVHAAASGVGTAAIQLANAWGATVIALSRSAEKRRHLSRLGADHVIDSATQDLEQLLRSDGADHGVDVVLDLVGASALSLNATLLRERGRLIVVGLLGGSRSEIDLSAFLRKRLTLIGTVLRGRTTEEKILLTREFARQALPLFEGGKQALRPVVDRVLPIEQAAEAHAVMERNENLGKIVLRVSGEPGERC